MTDIQKLALKMIIDPDLDKSWAQVFADQRLDPEDDVDGERFCSGMYTQWIYAGLAKRILAGDDAELERFIEEVDSKRLIRGEFESGTV